MILIFLFLWTNVWKSFAFISLNHIPILSNYIYPLYRPRAANLPRKWRRTGQKLYTQHKPKPLISNTESQDPITNFEMLRHHQVPRCKKNHAWRVWNTQGPTSRTPTTQWATNAGVRLPLHLIAGRRRNTNVVADQCGCKGWCRRRESRILVELYFFVNIVEIPGFFVVVLQCRQCYL